MWCALTGTQHKEHIVLVTLFSLRTANSPHAHPAQGNRPFLALYRAYDSIHLIKKRDVSCPCEIRSRTLSIVSGIFVDFCPGVLLEKRPRCWINWRWFHVDRLGVSRNESRSSELTHPASYRWHGSHAGAILGRYYLQIFSMYCLITYSM